MISFPFALVVYINLIKLWYEVKLRGLTITLIKADAFSACHSIRLMRADALLESDENRPCSGSGSGLVQASTPDANRSGSGSHLNQLNESGAERRY